MEVEVRGLNEAIARLEYLRRAVPDAVVGAMAIGAGVIFAESQVEVPKRTGALAASGRVSPVIKDGNEYRVAISYGPISYARIVHYNNRLHHETGKSYFVIDPLHQVGNGILDAQAAAVKAVANG